MNKLGSCEDKDYTKEFAVVEKQVERRNEEVCHGSYMCVMNLNHGSVYVGIDMKYMDACLV